MAGSIGVVTGLTISKSGWTISGRLAGQLGTLITQASLSSITYNVRDLTAGTNVTAAPVSLTIASVVFDSLQQNDPRWDKDSATAPGKDGRWGFNFLAVIPAVNFTAYDVLSVAPFTVTPHRFAVDVEFTPVTGEKFRQSWQSTPVPTWP
jgi:hypothetical protein